MTNIVYRLNASLSAGYSELRKEAAAEITRLHARIEEMEKEYQHALETKEIYQRQLNETEDERDALRIENVRLSTELKEHSETIGQITQRLSRLADENVLLRAEIEEMERQKPEAKP